MKSPLLTMALIVALQGCASTHEPQVSLADAATDPSMPQVCHAIDAANCLHDQVNKSSPATLHTMKVGAVAEATLQGSEIMPTSTGPLVEGTPLTSVVVTQCNMVVAVYMTMQDGRLLRFDQKAAVPAEDLVSVAYTAASSERVEVACDGMGAKGFETHKPI